MATTELARAAVQDVLDTQLEGNDPPETRRTLQRLEGLGYSRDAAKNLIACVLAVEMRSAGAARGSLDARRYLAHLQRLPKLPGE
jgi:hypothetical protein